MRSQVKWEGFRCFISDCDSCFVFQLKHAKRVVTEGNTRAKRVVTEGNTLHWEKCRSSFSVNSDLKMLSKRIDGCLSFKACFCPGESSALTVRRANLFFFLALLSVKQRNALSICSVPKMFSRSRSCCAVKFSKTWILSNLKGELIDRRFAFGGIVMVLHCDIWTTEPDDSTDQSDLVFE